MTIGYDGLWAINNRTSRGNYCRLLIEAASKEVKAEKFYIYSDKPNNSPHLVALLANSRVSLKTPHYSFSTILWRTGGIRKDLKRHHVRIFHGLSGILPLRTWGSRTHWVLSVNDLYFRYNPTQYSALYRLWSKMMTKRSCRKAERIIVPSQWGKEDLIKTYHLPEDRIDVVPPSYSDIFKQPVPNWALEDVRRTNNLPQRYVLAMGPLDPYKNLKTLIKAIALTRDTDVKLVIVGNVTNHYKRELKPAIAHHGVSDRVIHLKHIRTSDLPALYQMATIMACPAVNSYYSIAMLEAMAMGIPVIVSAQTALEQEGGEAVMTAGRDDAQQWADAIDALLDPQQHQHYEQLARAKAEEYTLERMGKALQESYDKIPHHND